MTKVARTLAQVTTWERDQGYRLEHIVQQALQRHGFRATVGRTYVDPATNKVRDIDVVADVGLTRTPAHIQVVVECKSRTTGAWIIRLAPMGPAHKWLPLAHEPLLTTMRGKGWVLYQALPMGDPAGFAIVEAAPQDRAFEAVTQAVSAARAWFAITNGPALVLPVVVVGGPLFTLAYDGAGTAQIKEVKSARLAWQTTGLPAPILVEIVTEAAVEEWASRTRQELGALAEALIEVAGATPI